MDRGKFSKEQKESLEKALSAGAFPLKQKHVRRLILGTYQEQSCSLFWANVNGIKLHKHPLLTWKFCHLLHSLIRDGHPSVAVESYRHLRRVSTLGDFWLHLYAYGAYGGYEAANEQYCSMLCERLEFHRKYPQIPGNLEVPESILLHINSNLAFDAAIDLLDQMKSILLLIRRVFNCLKIAEGSLTPQIQTLLAPLNLLITDTSKFFNLLNELMIHLHSIYHPDTLWRHMKRLQETLNQMAEFYKQLNRIPYLARLVTVPQLPAFPEYRSVPLSYPPSALMMPD